MRRSALYALIALCACGRVGFDVPGGGDDIPAGDGSPGSGDGGGSQATGDGGIDAPPDAPPDTAITACTNATTIGVGRTGTLSTCTGTDFLDMCSPGKQEIVFRFVAPTSAGYTMRAYDGATQNTSNSTMRFNAATCMPTGGCAGVIGAALTAGTTYYFGVESSGGACANIQFEIVAN